METNVNAGNILFHLSSGKDLSNKEHESTDSKQSSLDCKNIVISSFSPQIPVSCSIGAEKIATDLGFHSFFQILKPFGDKIPHKFQIKDSQMISRTADDFSLRFTRPLNDLLEVQEAGKTQLFSHQSLELLMQEYLQKVTPSLEHSLEEGKKGLTKLLKDSIYIKYFSKLLSSSRITPFEYINHPVASLLIISASENFEQAKQLLNGLRSTKLPEFLNIDDILPIFIVVHDENNEADREKALQLREHIKKQLLVDSFVLSLSFSEKASTTPLCPPQLLSVDEELQNTHLSPQELPKLAHSSITSIYQLLKEIIQKKLIPFMEMKIATWDELVVTPRSSITGRFFSASRKYFGGKNQSNIENHSNYDTQKGFYRSQSTEALTRKLADWSFMLRDYRYAYTTYDLSKKDYLSDKAWSHLASTQEMAAFSLLMGATNITSKLRTESIDPLLDSANYTYMSRCGLKTYALRSILIIVELFCTLRDGWSNAPAALSWAHKALDGKLVGRVGRSLLLQRIAYIYSLDVSNQAKIIISREKIDQNSTSENEDDDNPRKLNKDNIATIGLTRNRKSAFWSLLAAKDWGPTLQPTQTRLNLEHSEKTYKELYISERDSSLFKKLNVTTQNKISTSS